MGIFKWVTRTVNKANRANGMPPMRYYMNKADGSPNYLGYGKKPSKKSLLYKYFSKTKYGA